MALQGARAVWGTALLLAPRQMLDLVGDDPSPRVVRLTRVLGARHLLELAIVARERRQAPPRWPVTVDLVHAASMLAIAAYARPLRRDALTSAVVAVLLAGWQEFERSRG